MTQRINFTKSKLAAISPPAEGRTYLYDIKTTGLAFCISAAGSKSFWLYRKIAGRPERIRIGDYPQMTVEQARDEADRMNGRIADGQNPNDSRRVNRAAPKLGEVFDEYLEAPSRGKAKKTRSPKTTKDYAWQFKAHLEHWRGRKLSQIKRRDIEKLHNEIGAKNGQYLANRVLALLKAIFNYAVEQEYFPTNPATRLRAFQERSRDRFLQEGELPKFWEAVEAEPMADFFKLSLLTGARQDNVRRMQWADIDLEAAVWRIPHTKSGQPVTLPLSPEAVKLLRERRDANKGPWVFPGRGVDGPAKVPRHGWKRVLKAAGLSDLRLHDLRRTLGSWQTMGGSNLATVGESLGHTSLAATQIYARIDQQTVRDSIAAATAAIVKAATPKEGAANGEA